MVGINTSNSSTKGGALSSLNKHLKKPAKAKAITKPSDRSNRIKTGSQRAKEAQKLDIKRSGIRGAQAAIKNSRVESGKGNSFFKKVP